MVRSALLLLAMICALPVAAQEPPASLQAPGEIGRFSFAPVPDGVMRLDTRTGQVSFCQRRATGWSCESVADDRAAYESEIARQSARIANLEAQLKRSPDEKNRLKLPSDEEVDRAMRFLEQMYRRFLGAVQRLQREMGV